MICVEVLGEKNRCILSLRFVFKYWSGLREVFSNDYRNARLDDSCLFTGNLGKGVAQELGVVEADVGDDSTGLDAQFRNALLPETAISLHHG